MISSQLEKDIGFVLLQHPRWKIHRNCLMLQLYHPLNTSMCELGEASCEACVCVCVWENQRQVSDVTGELIWAGSWCIPVEQTRGSGGEKSDTKPERDHILVCQTSAFLPNPHTESLIIPPCCSPSLCLSLSLSLTHSLYPSLSFFHLSVMLFICLNWPHSLHFSLNWSCCSIRLNSRVFCIVSIRKYILKRKFLHAVLALRTFSESVNCNDHLFYLWMLHKSVITDCLATWGQQTHFNSLSANCSTMFTS